MRAIFRGDSTIDFVGRMGLFAVISTVLVATSIVLTTAAGLNFGIDFAGGYEIQAKFPKAMDDAQLKKLLEPAGVLDARVQRFGDPEDNEFLILVREHGTIDEATKAKLTAELSALVGGPDKATISIAESGETVKAEMDAPVAEEKVRKVFTDNGLVVKGIERGDREDKPVFRVSVVSLADKMEEALRKGLNLAADDQIVQRVEFVGPQVGAQLRNQGIMAVVWALFFILIYVGFRFDLNFAPGAIVALIHDIAITLGVFAAFQLEFNLPIIAAILAIVGYSLNDTIVVYDRIRENVVRLRGRDLRGMVNTSINQTLSRTLLTSITTLLVVIALVFFGGGIIRDFSIALLVGILVGTYSSVAIATPVYVLLRQRAEAKAAENKKKTDSTVALRA